MTSKSTTSDATPTAISLPPGFTLLMDGATSLWMDKALGVYLEIALDPANGHQWRYTLEPMQPLPTLDGRPALTATTEWTAVLAVVLAYQFAQDLRAILTDADWRAMRRKNVEITPGCCASHDYLDANMVMDPAFTRVIGRSLEADRDEDAAIWSAAWEFATTHLLTEYPDEETAR